MPQTDFLEFTNLDALGGSSLRFLGRAKIKSDTNRNYMLMIVTKKTGAYWIIYQTQTAIAIAYIIAKVKLRKILKANPRLANIFHTSAPDICVQNPLKEKYQHWHQV